MPNQAENKSDGVINPQNYKNIIKFFMENLDALKTPRIELAYMCHWGLSGPPAVTLTK